jgi:hypothetical protein
MAQPEAGAGCGGQGASFLPYCAAHKPWIRPEGTGSSERERRRRHLHMHTHRRRMEGTSAAKRGEPPWLSLRRGRAVAGRWLRSCYAAVHSGHGSGWRAPEAAIDKQRA